MTILSYDIRPPWLCQESAMALIGVVMALREIRWTYSENPLQGGNFLSEMLGVKFFE